MGAARTLFQVAAAHPEAVWDVVRHERGSQRLVVTSENRVSQKPRQKKAIQSRRIAEEGMV